LTAFLSCLLLRFSSPFVCYSLRISNFVDFCLFLFI
jgi:hypothetical protein